jgi:hypothetical protein
MIKDKAAGKILGELPFSESKSNIRDRKQLVLNAHLENEMLFNDSKSFKSPYEQLVLVDRNGQLPKIAFDSSKLEKLTAALTFTPFLDMDGLELAQKAAESTKENLEINFTSPYPQAHYETVFDEKKATEENCIGEKVFIYHGHGFLFLNLC